MGRFQSAGAVDKLYKPHDISLDPGRTVGASNSTGVSEGAAVGVEVKGWGGQGV